MFGGEGNKMLKRVSLIFFSCGKNGGQHISQKIYL